MNRRISVSPALPALRRPALRRPTQTLVLSLLWVLSATLGLTLGLGCGEENAASPAATGTGLTPEFATTQDQSLCMVGTQVSCPCIGGALGSQTCLPGGNAYGPCMGCPAPASPAAAPPMMNVAAAAPSGGAMAGSAPSSTADPSGPLVVDPAAMSMAAMSMNDGSDEGTAGSLIDGAAADGGDTLQTEVLGVAPAGSEPGTSCGVGLPVLCDLQSEKCCIRSLATDSCIASEDSCSCDLPGCTTTVARCDGPEDCADGQVCCGTLSNSGFLGGSAGAYDSFECTTQCDSVGSNSRQREACHEDEDTCPSGTICANSQILTNVQICIEPSTISQ